MRKGMILAGGSGKRLYPATKAVSEQLMPIYDKPMVYYPLSILMMAGIREILIITTPHDAPAFEYLFGDGNDWGIHISHTVQSEPAGLAQAFHLGDEFIGNNPSALILGDYLFYGHGLPELLHLADCRDHGATVFGYHVNDPERYGVVEFDANSQAVSIEEKPEKPKSNYAVTGLYFYDNQVVDFSKAIKPSDRGELEITDVNRLYMEQGSLNVEIMGRGFAWLDTGTHDSLVEASMFAQVIERRQGMKICCPEESAWENGYIDDEQLQRLAAPLIKKYLWYVSEQFASPNFQLMRIVETSIADVKLIEPTVFGDDRSFFMKAGMKQPLPISACHRSSYRVITANPPKTHYAAFIIKYIDRRASLFALSVVRFTMSLWICVGPHPRFSSGKALRCRRQTRKSCGFRRASATAIFRSKMVPNFYIVVPNFTPLNLSGRCCGMMQI